MVALILLCLGALSILVALAAFAYLVKTISLFVILAGMAVLMVVGCTSFLVGGLVFLVLHQLVGHDLLPYSLLLAIGIGLGASVVFVRKIGAELMAFMRRIQRWLDGGNISPTNRI
jgi:hypothetical protein